MFAPGEYNTAAFDVNGNPAWSRNYGLSEFTSTPTQELKFGSSLPRL